jgi:glycine betaine/choline ABC-type transport system substrate-binding protein
VLCAKCADSADKNHEPQRTRRITEVSSASSFSVLASSLLVARLFAGGRWLRRRADRIVVGSKNFTENLILGEMFAQMIEARTHLLVERRFYLAGTFICQQAILGGRIDIYPEYTGTALTAVLKKQPSGDKQEVYRDA